jgi:xanthine dehydrogenase FAD-binding subunit
MFAFKQYQKAESVQDAIDRLQADPGSRPIAGGTDVLIRLRAGKAGFEQLVDIHDLPELRHCTLAPDGTVVIGSGSTFADLTRSPVIRQHLPILAVAAASVGGPQIRNVATIGGNICNGVTSADSAAPLLAIEAKLDIEGPDGSRRLDLSDFYQGPGRTVLQPCEILTALRIAPAGYRDCFGHYEKYAMRQAMDIATIGCAAVSRIGDGRLVELRLAYGVAAPVPIRCPKAEAAATGQPLTPALLDRIADAVAGDVDPRTSWRASKDFRLHIISELARRVVAHTIEQAGGMTA